MLYATNLHSPPPYYRWAKTNLCCRLNKWGTPIPTSYLLRSASRPATIRTTILTPAVSLPRASSAPSSLQSVWLVSFALSGSKGITMISYEAHILYVLYTTWVCHVCSNFYMPTWWDREVEGYREANNYSRMTLARCHSWTFLCGCAVFKNNSNGKLIKL